MDLKDQLRRIHGYAGDSGSEDDSIGGDFDDFYHKNKPPAIPYHEIENKIVRIHNNRAEVRQSPGRSRKNNIPLPTITSNNHQPLWGNTDEQPVTLRTENGVWSPKRPETQQISSPGLTMNNNAPVSMKTSNDYWGGLENKILPLGKPCTGTSIAAYNNNQRTFRENINKHCTESPKNVWSPNLENTKFDAPAETSRFEKSVTTNPALTFYNANEINMIITKGISGASPNKPPSILEYKEVPILTPILNDYGTSFKTINEQAARSDNENYSPKLINDYRAPTENRCNVTSSKEIKKPIRSTPVNNNSLPINNPKISTIRTDLVPKEMIRKSYSLKVDEVKRNENVNVRNLVTEIQENCSNTERVGVSQEHARVAQTCNNVDSVLQPPIREKTFGSKLRAIIVFPFLLIWALLLGLCHFILISILFLSELLCCAK